MKSATSSVRSAPERNRVDPWPAEDLEHVAQCPVCNSAERTLLHDDLTDCVFFCAPGTWTLYSCSGCGSAYLDPRPTESSIHKAYTEYFTHNCKISISRTLFGRVRHSFASTYRDYRYGNKTNLVAPFTLVATYIFPMQRAILDAGMRHLPCTPGRLLDIGCGNGDFLLQAQRYGWDVMGIDLDRVAVDVAQHRGLDVRNKSVDNMGTYPEEFDGITLSHVIEHVHDPLSLLRRCHDLLKPGGWIWIDTPNLHSKGHTLFGSAWRGLEPPRHLSLFTRASLIRAVDQCGFRDVSDMPWRPLCRPIFSASKAIARSHSDLRKSRIAQLRERAICCVSDRAERRDASLREFVTIRANK